MSMPDDVPDVHQGIVFQCDGDWPARISSSGM